MVRGPQQAGARLAGSRLAGSLLAGGLVLVGGPVLAGSVTVESIFSEQAARQLAMSNIPAGAAVGRVTCQDISVRGDDRYRCTAYFSPAPAPAPAGPQQP